MIDVLLEKLYGLQDSMENVAIQIMAAIKEELESLPNQTLMFEEAYAKPAIYTHKNDDDQYEVKVCFINGAKVVDNTLFILYNNGEENGEDGQIDVNNLSLENAIICFEAIKNNLK